MGHFYLVMRYGRVDAVFRYYPEAFVWVKANGGRILRDDTYEQRYGLHSKVF